MNKKNAKKSQVIKSFWYGPDPNNPVITAWWPGITNETLKGNRDLAEAAALHQAATELQAAGKTLPRLDLPREDWASVANDDDEVLFDPEQTKAVWYSMLLTTKFVWILLTTESLDGKVTQHGPPYVRMRRGKYEIIWYPDSTQLAT